VVDQTTYFQGMPDPIRARPTPWKTVILLCGKCARKMDGGGYGSKGRDTLRTILREAFGENGHRRDVKIIETRCMGICPKKAVTALNASRPGNILTIPKGTAATEAMAQLMNDAKR
jgi:predicted metal-binding protein